MAKAISCAKAVAELTALFYRNGYLRFPNVKRKKATPRKYKKGYEVRLVANSKTELRTIRQLLRAAGFTVARPFAKGKQWRQPVYGQQAVMRFLDLVGWPPENA